MTRTAPLYAVYAYELAGNLDGFEDFDGRVTFTTYDGDNRVVTSTDSASGTPTITNTTGYDPDGNVLARTEQTVGGQGQPLTHTYTATLNATDWTTATGDTLSDGKQLVTQYGDDGAGQQCTQTVVGGLTPVTTMLDAAGRATSIGETSAGSGPYTSTFGSIRTISRSRPRCPVARACRRTGATTRTAG